MPLPVDMEKRYVTEVKKGPGGNKMEKLLSNYDKMVIIEAALKKGMSVKAIASLTDLSEVEVKEIVKSLIKEAA